MAALLAAMTAARSPGEQTRGLPLKNEYKLLRYEMLNESTGVISVFAAKRVLGCIETPV